VLDTAPDCRRAHPADQQRRPALLYRRRADRARVASVRAGPDLAELGQLGVERGAPAVEVGGRGGVVIRAATGRDADGEPATGEAVDAGQLLGQQGAVAPERRDQDGGGEPGAAGDRRRGGQRRDGLVVAVYHPVQRAEAGKTGRVGLVCPGEHVRAGRAEDGGRQSCSEIHDCQPSGAALNFDQLAVGELVRQPAGAGRVQPPRADLHQPIHPDTASTHPSRFRWVSRSVMLIVWRSCSRPR
jgi:hypothetical protein